MVTDPIADLLIQIKNASMAGRVSVVLPSSKMKVKVAEILVNEGYIAHFEQQENDGKKTLSITLKYHNKKSVLTDLKRRSKPGLRLYVPKSEIPTVLGGMGIAILSTSQGVMTGTEAKKLGIGGELLCTIW